MAAAPGKKKKKKGEEEAQEVPKSSTRMTAMSEYKYVVDDFLDGADYGPEYLAIVAGQIVVRMGGQSEDQGWRFVRKPCDIEVDGCQMGTCGS